MSNSASLSAAKRRRGGVPPPMGSPQGQPPMNASVNGLPPGLPANFRQLPQQVQQQLIRQLQQRMGASAPAVQPTLQKQNTSMPPPIATRPSSSEAPSTEPYAVNSVIHNHAMSQINGLSLRDLPMSAAGLPCLPSGGPLPPNILFKLHHDDLLHKDILLNELSIKLQGVMNRVDKVEKGSSSYSSVSNSTHTIDDASKGSLVDDSDFISKVVDNILTNTNLSDIINQIEPLQKENESLRLLINSQQKTLNELSGLVMKLLNNGLPSYNGVENTYIQNLDTNTNTDTNTYTNEQYVYNPNLDSDVNSSVYIPGSDGDKNETEYTQECDEGAEEGEEEEEGEGETDGVTLVVKTTP